MKNFIIVLIIFSIFTGCTKKTRDIKETKENERQETVEIETEIITEIINEDKPLARVYSFDVNNPFPSTEYEPVPEEITALLCENEERYLKGDFVELTFVHRINFGIPDGDNYIALWKDKYDRTFPSYRICLYAISDKIENCYLVHTGINFLNFNANIMNNIPGIHIWQTAASFFDANGDGFDNIFSYGFYGMGNFVDILGYDNIKKEVINYCDMISFEDNAFNDTGLPPVIFSHYKNKIGFIVYKYAIDVGDTIPVNLINNYYAWYYYTFDENEKEYYRLEEYLENETEQDIDINSYPVEYFEMKIHYWKYDTSPISIDSMKDITPKHQGGRSFILELRDVTTQETYTETYDFDDSGRTVWDYY